VNRRTLLTGLLASTTALAIPPGLRPVLAASNQKVLSIGRRTIEVNGKPANVFRLGQTDGTPGLRFTAGDRFDVLLRNQTAESTIVHWHGLTPPWQSDGVAGAPLPLIEGGTDRSFDFPIDRPGTYWMHAHTLQEQQLLAAPLIVADPADASVDEQEIVVLLHDFSFKTPEELLAELTSRPPNGMAGMAGMAMDSSPMVGMDMSGAMTMDLNDIEYDAYLANDRTLDDPEIIQVERGGRVRLRLINGATATAFTIDLGPLSGELIAVDGHNIQAVRGSRFPMTMGQRIDIRLQLPNEATAFPILALREGAPQRTGFILAAAGAAIARLPMEGTAAGPILDLALEASLRAIDPLAGRAADKHFTLALAGDMAAYAWAIRTDLPVVVDKGDRVEVTMTNHSMMAHPMHLHGHRFQVVGIDGRRVAGAVRDTVLVPPMRSVTVAVDAINPGQWAFHCHHLYHMATGMMATFGYRA
jgi:FtsP/CotA-like multicopper oxidase with cupredoxin domain